jgi:hypothetical protein
MRYIPEKITNTPNILAAITPDGVSIFNLRLLFPLVQQV